MQWTGLRSGLSPGADKAWKQGEVPGHLQINAEVPLGNVPIALNAHIGSLQ